MKDQNSGFGYEKLIVYWLATSIYDLTVIFCDRYIDKRSRTHDQMVQAARSGKQNIVEGSLSKSHESNIKLADVSHNSYGELLEDYKDYLRQKGLSQWAKEDPRISHEAFANLMLTLCYKQIYLMSQFLKANQQRFIKEGGFRENLFKKRLEYRKQI